MELKERLVEPEEKACINRAFQSCGPIKGDTIEDLYRKDITHILFEIAKDNHGHNNPGFKLEALRLICEINGLYKRPF